MELDAGFTRRVTSEEKERRKQKNLCLRCGKSGHYARNCYNTGRWQSNGNRDYKGKQPDRRYNQPSRYNAAANETRPREEETRPREGTQKGIPTARWSQNASANISANAATADTAAATNDTAPEPETGYDSNPESPMYTPEEGSDTEDTPDSDTDEIDLLSKSGPGPDLETDRKNYPQENYKASKDFAAKPNIEEKNYLSYRPLHAIFRHLYFYRSRNGNLFERYIATKLGTFGTRFIGKKKAPKEVRPDRIHALISWTCCYNDRCPTHLSEKEGSNYWPHKVPTCKPKYKITDDRNYQH